MIGYDSINRHGILWRKNQKVLMPITPPGDLPELEVSQVYSLLKSSGCLLVRWESKSQESGPHEWWHVHKKKSEISMELSKKVRYQVKKGFKKYTCSILSKEDILSEGYSVYKSSFGRYNTHEKIYTIGEFLKAVKNMPVNTEFWGVREIETGVLVGFSENILSKCSCFYNTMWFTPSAMKNYSAYALIHQMNSYYLVEAGLDYISNGSKSLSHDTSMHDFLISKFGFAKTYYKLNVLCRPYLYFILLILFPIRKVIGRSNLSFFKKIHILLCQEEIRRSFIN